ncbi:hypothetical protein ACVS9P_01940 [Caproicibacterium sp. NSD3]
MRKMDEMELAISLRAIRWAYLFTALALFVWGTRDLICQGKITMPIYLLIFQNLVYYFSTIISKIKVGDEEEKKAFIGFPLLTVAFLIAFGVLLLLFPGK